MTASPPINNALLEIPAPAAGTASACAASTVDSSAVLGASPESPRSDRLAAGFAAATGEAIIAGKVAAAIIFVTRIGNPFQCSFDRSNKWFVARVARAVHSWSARSRHYLSHAHR